MRKDYALTSAQKIDARAALKLLDGSGISLEDAARKAIEGKRALKRVTVQEAADMFLRIKLNKRPATASWYLSRINLLCVDIGDRMIDEVTRAEFREWLNTENLGAAARAGRVRAVKALWRWAIAQEPQLAVNDITGGLPTQSSRQSEDIRFLSVSECSSIMEGAGKYTAALALMLFAGIRPEEIRSKDKPPLLWRHINIDERIIRIPGDIAKTGRARLIEGLPNTVWQWLTVVVDQLPSNDPKLARQPICPYISVQAVRHAKALAGYGPDNPWPSDALRHSFATYHVAAFNDPGLCAMLMGHEGNPTMLHRHYRGLATKKEAQRFWQIAK